MTDIIKGYPLCWPDGWPRAKHKEYGRFKRNDRRLNIADAARRVYQQLELLDNRISGDNIVISTNVRARLDGLPRSDRLPPEPSDVGVAVYWETSKGKRQVMAIDHYDRVADNLAAIAATLDALRAIKRHGGAIIMERAFTGFVALPSPEQWWHVLGFETMNVSVDEIIATYQKLAAQHHPDREGGDNDTMARINAARDEALRTVGQ